MSIDKQSEALPRMPSEGEVDPPSAERWRRRLRRFHLTGEQPEGAAEVAGALTPAWLPALRREHGEDPYPLPCGLALDRSTLIELYLSQLRSARDPVRRSFRQRVEDLERKLTELLQIDRDRSGASARPEALSTSLGEGQAFLDLDRLSRQLPGTGAAGPLDDGRRERVARVLRRLRAYSERGTDEPLAVLLCAEDQAAPPPVEDVRISSHADPLRAATEVFVQQVSELLPTVRAAHLAGLLLEGKFEPELHDVLLERLDWKAFRADELQQLPQVVVLESARRVRGNALGAMSELLRSGFPVHLLLAERVGDLGAAELRESLSGDHVSLASLALAHREAFVLQSSLGCAPDLTRGLERMAEARGPAVAVVTCPDWASPTSPWDQLAAASHGRSAPCFRYEAERGDSYAERFVLGDNPQPQQMWPGLSIEYLDEAKTTASRTERFTFAHLAALTPAYREHLALIPTRAWSDEQLEIGDYLDLPRERRRRSLPFVWVLDAAGELARAVLTRELAFAASGRARAWRVLQELGGTDNEYANRAAEQARRSAEAEAEQRIAALRTAHAEELEQAGERAVSQAMQRLAASLLSMELGAPAAEPASPEAVVEEAATEVAPPPPAVAETEGDDESFDDPYIDTPLCTTCNECTNINSRMFAYDENRQAFIKDAVAGTFDELVRAAEKCPARCIHPGAPRSDDASATDELIARARAFD